MTTTEENDTTCIEMLNFWCNYCVCFW